jgi:hypothetical protein
MAGSDRLCRVGPNEGAGPKEEMSRWAGFITIALCCGWLALADDACPKAAMGSSHDIPELSWTSGAAMSGSQHCTRQEIVSHPADRPLAIEWLAAGIHSAEIGGKFASSLCCFEGIYSQSASLKYGSPAKSLATPIDAGIEDQDNDDYPDLIEDDARTMRSSFVGKLWDGSKFVDADIEFRAAASYPHSGQSVFQFIIVDRSPQRLSLSWDLPVNLAKTMEPYYTSGEEGARRQDIYVFFGKKRPAPAHGVVEVRTSGGKVLARFAAAGFLPEENETTKKK